MAEWYRIDANVSIDVKNVEKYFSNLPVQLTNNIQIWMAQRKKTVERKIRAKLPVGRDQKYPPKGMKHKHAKENLQSTLAQNIFLGYFVRTERRRSYTPLSLTGGKKSKSYWYEYGYLFFPESGTGYTQPKAQKFFESTKEEEEPITIKALNRIINKTIESDWRI